MLRFHAPGSDDGVDTASSDDGDSFASDFGLNRGHNSLTPVMLANLPMSRQIPRRPQQVRAILAVSRLAYLT